MANLLSNAGWKMSNWWFSVLLLLSTTCQAIDFDRLDKVKGSGKKVTSSDQSQVTDSAARLQNQFVDEDYEERRRSAERAREYAAMQAQQQAQQQAQARENEKRTASQPRQDRYVCVVNCLNPSGKTRASVSAESASKAASILDGQADAVCRSAGFGKATSYSMSSSQCSRN